MKNYVIKVDTQYHPCMLQYLLAFELLWSTVRRGNVYCSELNSVTSAMDVWEMQDLSQGLITLYAY